MSNTEMTEREREYFRQCLQAVYGNDDAHWKRLAAAAHNAECPERGQTVREFLDRGSICTCKPAEAA